MELLGLLTLTFLATFIGTLTGFGASTIMMPFVVLIFPLPIALLFVGILHWFNDIWKIILFKRGVRWKLILYFGIPGVLFSFLGANIALSIESAILTKLLGLVLVLYPVLIFAKPKFKIPSSSPAAVAGGALSGLMAGIFGVGGAVRGMFLSAFNFKKEVYLATSGAIALLIDSARIITYFSGGTRLDGVLLWGLILFIPATFIGAELAKKLVNKIPQEKFRKVVLIFLLLVGLKLLL